jgi:hypothetical protein
MTTPPAISAPTSLDEFLAHAADECAAVGVPMTVEDFEPRFHRGPMPALTFVAEDGTWDIRVLAVQAIPVVQGRRGAEPEPGRRLSRAGYGLDGDRGAPAYEMHVYEVDSGWGGHGPRPLVDHGVWPDAQALAAAVFAWTRRAELHEQAVPPADPAAPRRRRRIAEHRAAARQDPRVDFGLIEPVADEDASALDQAALAEHFPRGASGRFDSKALVALACYTEGARNRPGLWLAARSRGDRLQITTESMIGANRAHRWDHTRWLWDSRHADTPAAVRWGADDVAAVRPVLDALAGRRVADALTLCGVEIDDDLGKVLMGRPTRVSMAEETPKFVTRAYGGLADAAPWRFAEALRLRHEERVAQRVRAASPSVVLFSLSGGHARQPCVVLEDAKTGPRLRLQYTGSSERLSRSLWTVPGDLHDDYAQTA